MIKISALSRSRISLEPSIFAWSRSRPIWSESVPGPRTSGAAQKNGTGSSAMKMAGAN